MIKKPIGDEVCQLKQIKELADDQDSCCKNTTEELRITESVRVFFLIQHLILIKIVKKKIVLFKISECFAT